MVSCTLSATGKVLYKHAIVITVNDSREVFLDGAVLTDGGRIAAVGRTDEVIEKRDAETEEWDCRGKIIIPGLINTHAHLAQSLLRGLAEGLPLHSWLCDAIWPLEASYEGDDGYIAAMLTIAEMLRSGTTCFLEAMLTHRSGFDNVVRAVEQTGIRACLGKLIKAVESNATHNMTDARDRDVREMSVSSALSAYNQYHGTLNGRLEVWLAAGTPRGSPMSVHAAIGAAAKAHGIGVTMHCAEAPGDLAIFRKHYGLSPLEFCHETGLTSPRTVLAHVVHPEASTDFAIMHETGTTASHNPTSNCKLGSGISPVPDMLAAGVNVALGTDGAPCNNSYDMFREMHLAAILHSGARQTAGILPAYTALEMATINGARALGLDKDIGSLEVGKKADLVIVHPPAVSTAPFDVTQVETLGGQDPITVLVHSCTGADVESVIVDGQPVMQRGRVKGFDEAQMIKKAREAIQRIRERSGVKRRSDVGLKYI